MSHVMRFNGFQTVKNRQKGLWQPSSPDLSKCDLYLWGYLKGKVCESNPHTSRWNEEEHSKHHWDYRSHRFA